MTYPKKIDNNRWILEVKENNETKELYIDIPEDALNQVGWDIGDDLLWEELPNNQWSIKKVDKTTDQKV